MPNEPMPASEVLDELDSQWNASNVTEPNYIEVTGANDPVRFNLNKADYVIGRAGSPEIQETPIANYKYGNRVYRVVLEVYTKDSRQKLYNIMREIRRICHARVHSLTNFQRITFNQFAEDNSEQANVWVGTVDIELVNNAVLLEIT